MRIDKNLNFVFPIESVGRGVVYVHSTPISRSVFEQFYDVLGKVFTKCFDGQDPKHIALTAPQLALPAIKAAAVSTGTWDGPNGVQRGLVNEIIRLSSVASTGDLGWEMLPLDVAVRREILDDENEAEILSNLIFFTSISKVAPRALAGTFLEMAGSLRDWRFTSLGCMEYVNSLPTSTEEPITTPIYSPVIS